MKPEKELHSSLLDATNLLVIVLVLVVDNVVELELVDTGGGGDDAEPVTELLLLEELLGPNNRILSVHIYLNGTLLQGSALLHAGDNAVETYRYLR